jgi:hypothetical protein
MANMRGGTRRLKLFLLGANGGCMSETESDQAFLILDRKNYLHYVVVNCLATFKAFPSRFYLSVNR